MKFGSHGGKCNIDDGYVELNQQETETGGDGGEDESAVDGDGLGDFQGYGHQRITFL
jgi:hypothetical protein